MAQQKIDELIANILAVANEGTADFASYNRLMAAAQVLRGDFEPAVQHMLASTMDITTPVSLDELLTVGEIDQKPDWILSRCPQKGH